MRRFLLSLFILTVLGVDADAQTRTETSEAPAIRVVGTATASSNPDVVQLYVAVMTKAASAQATAAENARLVTTVLAALRAQLGVGSQVTTVSYSLDPNYVYSNSGGEPRLDGYIARNSLKVETTDLDKVGSVIDAAIAAGANNINGITYTLRDQTKLRSEALAEAARQARTKAEVLAAALGLRLVGIRLVDESTQSMPGPMYERMQFDKGAATTPIQTGPVEIRADVSITFDIARL